VSHESLLLCPRYRSYGSCFVDILGGGNIGLLSLCSTWLSLVGCEGNVSQ